MIAVIIFALDGTIANVALPHMAGSFSATRDESMWILTSYLIASGIVIPSVGFFSKFLGRKNFYVISILLFTVASLLCGMAQNLGQMVLFRILQGAGGGGIVPLSQAIMMESFPKNRRGTAMAVFGMGVIIVWAVLRLLLQANYYIILHIREDKKVSNLMVGAFSF